MSTDKTIEEKGLANAGVVSSFLAKSVQVTLGLLPGIAINATMIFGLGLLKTFYFQIGRPIFLSNVLFYSVSLFGATQLIGQLPVILLLMKKRTNLALGVMLAMSATALLWGVFFART
ncbi:MAG TPA: hypothetical protein VFA71_01250 [Terriglobales bacterium]|nr:hypothetical protein [Terriglobales bacterium]